MILPYKEETSDKRTQVANMFDNIAGNYDFLNHFLSLGIDILWRKKAIRIVARNSPKNVLDIATGTGDFAIEALKAKPNKITGVDISRKMLEIGIKKIQKKGLQDIITLKYGDSENLEFSDNTFDQVIVAFGVRNFQDLEKGIKEMHRVLEENGNIMILEFSKPTSFPFKQLYNFYFKTILPFIGRIISKDQAAYTYLPESVEAFPNGNNFLDLLKLIGFSNTKCIPLTFGVASIYIGRK